METTENTTKRLENLEKRVTYLEKLIFNKPDSMQEEISMRDFFKQKNPKNDNQKTLLMILCIEKFKNISPFNREDLEEGFNECREPIPENINDKVNQNKKKKYVMDVPESKNGLKSWKITNAGEKFVENDFKEEK